MAECCVNLGKSKIRLESNAYSLILYQDEFKRNFLKDFENICGLGDELDPVNYIRFLWCSAKTANRDIVGFDDFINEIEIGQIYSILSELIELIDKNLEVRGGKTKKLKARVLNIIHRRRKSSRMLQGKD